MCRVRSVSRVEVSMNIKLCEISTGIVQLVHHNWSSRQDQGLTWRIMASGGDDGRTPPIPDATTVSTRPPHPLITPDAFSGDGNWDKCIEHFEGSAQVNG